MIAKMFKRILVLLAITTIAGGLLTVVTSAPAEAAYAQNPPTNFRVTSKEATSVNLAWNANPSPANFYRVKYSTNSNFSNPRYQTVQNATSMRIMALQPNTRYYFQVRAIQLRSGSENGLSDYTKPGINTTTNLYYFNPPASLRVDEVYSNKLDISWGVVPNAHSYDISVTGKPIQNYVDMSTMQRVGTSIEGLSPNSSYTIRVRALQQQGQVLTDWRTITASTSAVEPGVEVTTLPPENLTVSDVASRLIGLSWDRVAGATGYRIQWWQGGPNPAESAVRYYSVPVSQTGSTAPSITFDGTLPSDLGPGASATINPRTTYSFRISALGDGIDTRISNYSSTRSAPESITTTNYPEVAPKNLSIIESSIDKTSARVTWEPVNGATNYRVAWSTSSSRPSRCEPNCVVTPAAGTAHTITGLNPGTRYYVWVSTVQNGDTISDYQRTPAQFRTVPAVEVPASIWQDALNSETSIRARWSAVTGATAYEYRWSRRSDMGGATSATNVGTATAATVTGLVPDQIHFFQIRVRSGSLTSAWSDAVALKTPVNYGAARGVINDAHGASATVIAYNSSGAQVSSSPVDPTTGEFLVKDLRPGPHTFQLMHSDNVSTTSPWFSASGGAGVPFRTQASSFTVPGWSNNASTSLVLPTLTPAAGRTITGTLSTETASCISDVRVVVKSNSTTSTGEVLADETLPGSWGTQRTFAIHGIPKGQPVRVWVFGNCADASASLAASNSNQNVSIEVFDLDSITIPSTIGGLSATNITAHDATLSWNTVPTATDYRVYIRTTNSFPGTCEPNCWIVTPAVAGSKGSIQLSSVLTPRAGQRYYFKVSARNSAGKTLTGWQSSATSFTLGAGPQIPSTVQNISATNITTSNATLSWDAVPTAEKYRVYIRPVNSFPGTCEPNCWVVNKNLSGTRSSVQLNSLFTPTPGTRYYVKISAINAANKTITSWQSSAYSFAMGGSAPTIPDTVQNITATGITNTNATISWDAVPTAATYRIYIRTTNSFPGTCEPNCWVVSPPISGGKASVNLNAYVPATPGTRYYVKVSASNAAGKLLTGWQPEAYSFSTTGSSPTIPDHVGGISASNIGQTNATLSWDAVPTAASYRVYIRPSDDFPYHCEPDCWVVSPTPAGGKASITLSDVMSPKPGASYFVKISASDANGKLLTGWQPEAYSFTMAGTPPVDPDPDPDPPVDPGTIPSAVQNIEASDLAANNAKLSWDAVPTAVKYRVYLRTTNSFPGRCEPNCWVVDDFETSGGKVSIDLNSIINPTTGVAYYVKVSAINGAGKTITGWQSSATSFRLAVDGIEAVNITSSNATLRWNTIPNAARYRVYIRTTDSFPGTCEPNCWLVTPTVSGGKASINLNSVLTPQAGQTYYVKISAVNSSNKILTGWQDTSRSFTMAG